MFFLSRMVVELFAPFILSILILCTGTFFLVLNKRKMALVCNTVGLAIILIFGYGLWSTTVMQERESAYPPFALNGKLPTVAEDVDYIAILGSGHVSDPRLPVTAQIGSSSLYRLVEGVRLSELLPEARIVITGGIGYDPIPNAEIVAKTANILGLDKSRLIVDDWPRDTLQEAEVLERLVGTQPFILVTSASHMKRAMEIVRSRGMNPIAAPTDYMFKNQLHKTAASFLPRPGNLELVRSLIYEYLGTLWAKIKKITKDFQ